LFGDGRRRPMRNMRGPSPLAMISSKVESGMPSITLQNTSTGNAGAMDTSNACDARAGRSDSMASFAAWPGSGGGEAFRFSSVACR
jgi:hypothetical protein